MDVRPHLDRSSSEPVLCGDNVGLAFCYARRHGHERPYNCLSPHSLNPVDCSRCFVVELVHPDVRGVVHGRCDRRCEQLSCCRWRQTPKSSQFHHCLQSFGSCPRYVFLTLEFGVHNHPEDFTVVFGLNLLALDAKGFGAGLERFAGEVDDRCFVGLEHYSGAVGLNSQLFINK